GSSPARRRDRPRPPRPGRRRPCHRHPDPDRRTARTTLEHPRLNPGARRRAPRSPAGSTPWTLQQPTAKRRPAVKSSPTGPRAARREAVTLDSRGKRSYPATDLLLLSHPTPRCPPTTAPACSNSTALNIRQPGWLGHHLPVPNQAAKSPPAIGLPHHAARPRGPPSESGAG